MIVYVPAATGPMVASMLPTPAASAHTRPALPAPLATMVSVPSFAAKVGVPCHFSKIISCPGSRTGAGVVVPDVPPLEPVVPAPPVVPLDPTPPLAPPPVVPGAPVVLGAEGMAMSSESPGSFGGSPSPYGFGRQPTLSAVNATKTPIKAPCARTTPPPGKHECRSRADPRASRSSRIFREDSAAPAARRSPPGSCADVGIT